jgi:hypothetical protein
MTDPIPSTDFAFTVWDIVNMERELPDGATPPNGQIHTIHYTVTRYDQSETAGSYGSVGLGDPNPDDYTPFSQITKEQAVGWVKDALGAEQVAAIETSLEAQIQEELNPTRSAGVPWRSTLES